ncbi:glycoside hydrolase family 27 protein [Fulvivirga ulvae]|uniref:glycoside hydrolase family 27 protein n=1 Tax=Fulvivirga ulvae TaxID=2904245 RepID=UPI001F1722CB|nr:glycoside hydrolase family 27 protein [Fulvivirga ulvae]UII32291.1 glycoside hydrolase family 27 protein [Fulvivirga ulvae]
MKQLIVAAFILLSLNLQAQKFEGLAPTPPMGWNSWNTFATDINEQLVKDIADKFVELGLKDAGYEYIVLDDGWMAKERDANGNLVADPEKFPGGMKALAAYVHSKGLKFGLYNCAGSETCAGYPGSRGYEYQDARLYASWDIDFLKYDWCNTEKLNGEGAYITMRDALAKAGRPVVFSICEWGDNEPWNWAQEVGHMWRISGDISNCWDCEDNHGTWSSWGVWKIINMHENIRSATGPDHWNDFDMMEVGNGMTAAEDRSHFAMWSLLASPLIMGNDLRSATEETIKTLTNKEVIGVNQDSLGIQGFRVANDGNIEIWAKPLANGSWAMTFVNMNEKPAELSFDWSEHTITDAETGKRLNTKEKTYQVKDLFNHKKLKNTKNKLKATIGVHDVLMVRLD